MKNLIIALIANVLKVLIAKLTNNVNQVDLEFEAVDVELEVVTVTDDELWDMYNSDGFFHKYDCECECSVCNSFR